MEFEFWCITVQHIINFFLPLFSLYQRRIRKIVSTCPCIVGVSFLSHLYCFFLFRWSVIGFFGFFGLCINHCNYCSSLWYPIIGSFFWISRFKCRGEITRRVGKMRRKNVGKCRQRSFLQISQKQAINFFYSSTPIYLFTLFIYIYLFTMYCLLLHHIG